MPGDSGSDEIAITTRAKAKERRDKLPSVFEAESR
jgi:hypothetical protein